MVDGVVQTLLSLSSCDSEVVRHTNEKHKIEASLQTKSQQVEAKRKQVQELETHNKELKLREQVEQHRLRDEQTRITERKKQLATVAGTKAQKLIEREIDIASRMLQVNEERALKAIEAAAEVEKSLTEARGALENIQAEFEGVQAETSKSIEDLSVKIAGVNAERLQFYSKLEDRLQKLYNRVKVRYPADPVAVAKSGSCMSCFRALPPQTYNQILAGNNLIQCPGCSRILVPANE
ncbi:hypothetical protein JNK13_06360 [bacterium]|nr:hypothetical protein [bacterium]